ncbi:hypothetical protein GGQ74_001957 [Desulfobaculum xiamenense]|uniref:DUF4234 domain-containing protein n=1 Tax=Desulfobaculum xiamenense TaxID=995050 RepID=A0A846QSY4_9BACT|nr:hypothetical protein [Desulfobaculum xiamenense]NJB68284.1 hypothetical protein [Desulfobaculum xiamenense]
MAEIHTLKNEVATKTWNLVLLAAATGGIFPIMWLYRKAPIINKITKITGVNDLLIIWIAVCAGLCGVFSSDPTNELMIGISGLLGLGNFVLYITAAFKMKTQIQEYALHELKLDLPMNRFYTCIFNIFYINYCINDMENVYRKHQIMSEAPQHA